MKTLRNTATDLQVPPMKTCNGQRALSSRGARVWNLLDSEVKQASCFKASKAASFDNFALLIIVIRVEYHFFCTPLISKIIARQYGP